MFRGGDQTVLLDTSALIPSPQPCSCCWTAFCCPPCLSDTHRDFALGRPRVLVVFILLLFTPAQKRTWPLLTFEDQKLLYVS